MPLQATSGAASYDAFGGGVAVVPQYIEDVFSTWLYTGTGNGSGTPGTVATITNGIDLSTKGGLVWLKNRGLNVDHGLYDTVRGALNGLQSNGTSGQGAYTNTLTAFTTSGFSLGNDSSNTANYSGQNYVSWTFRKQPKFFDVVTYTGTGVNNRQISHNLGSVPGSMIAKITSIAGYGWFVYHRSISPINQNNIQLNRTDSTSNGGQDLWGDGQTVVVPTSTAFTVGVTNNQAGETYVAYLFAHNAGGFGLTGTDNVISCGSYTAAASAVTVNLGYEPQWVMVKSATNAANWLIIDTMRGAPNTTASSGWANLYPNTSGAEQDFFSMITPTATGFIVDQNVNQSSLVNGSGTYIYIAIRRGPMRVPTDGTKVFAPVVSTSQGLITAGFPVDLTFSKYNLDPASWYAVDRLRSVGLNTVFLRPNTTFPEASTGGSFGITLDNNVGVVNSGFNSVSNVYHNFRRAPGFFDEVCYTGTGVARTVAHNLAAVPELMIVKSRSAVVNWKVYQKDLGTLYGSGNPAWQYNLTLNSTDSTDFSASRWSQDPTSTVFGVATNADTNGSGSTYVAYLFASCPGVSKVGSYTGTGTTQTINCGFTAGSRFVMIKRTDSTGDWYVWDSARGIVAGNDPYLLLNSAAAEVTNTDFIDTAATGFEISSTAPADINASGGTFIFFAVA